MFKGVFVWLKSWSSPVFYIVAGVLGLAALGILMEHVYEFFEIVFAFVVVAIVAFIIMDIYERSALYNFQSVDELKNGNIAVALYYIAFSIRILALAIVMYGALTFI